MTRPLYEITADVLRLAEVLDRLDDADNPGEIDPTLDGWLAHLEVEQAAKLDGYIHLIRQLRMEAVAARAEREQWAEKEHARTRRADMLEDRLRRHLEATGQLKVTTASGRVVSVVKNGGFAPLVLNEGFTPDDEDVPSDCIRIKREFDRTAIRARLEAGQPLPANFAKIGERGTSLRVK